MLAGSASELVVECRDCGANVEPETDICPICNSTEIASYEIGP
jgi:RNA polymerase subunit RPABC4/transcription elongation factor Spt4